MIEAQMGPHVGSFADADRSSTAHRITGHAVWERNTQGAKHFRPAVQPASRRIVGTVGISVTSLTPVEQTALLTVYARALDSRTPRPILGDIWADSAVRAIDYDFTGLRVQTSVACQTALRAKMLDDRVRKFTTSIPGAIVVDLGGGLDSGFYRVSPPPTVDWYSADLAGISAMRDHVLPANPRLHTVVASVAESDWATTIPADRPTILVADGLFAFLAEPVIAGALRIATRLMGLTKAGARKARILRYRF